MALLICAGLFVVLLFFWFRGNCIAWVLVGAMSFWLAQMSLQSPADTGFDIVIRGLWVLLLAGIPTCVWGDLARSNARRREAKARRQKARNIYFDLPPEDYSEYQ